MAAITTNNTNNNNDEITYDDVFNGKYINVPFYQIEIWGVSNDAFEVEMIAEFSDQFEVNKQEEEENIIVYLNEIVEDIKTTNEDGYYRWVIDANNDGYNKLSVRLNLYKGVDDLTNPTVIWSKSVEDIINPPPPPKSANKKK
mgnify:FL=1